MRTMLLVFVIGDSISMGWGKYLPAQRPPENCQDTAKVLAHLDEWAPNDAHWPVIVFNAGLWDVMNGVPVKQYADNLDKIVRRLRPRCDRLYFCSTTPGRAGRPRCTPERVDAYNRVALEVMEREHVPVLDLHRLCLLHRDWWLGGANIHYTEDGYKGMGEYVRSHLTTKD